MEKVSSIDRMIASEQFQAWLDDVAKIAAVDRRKRAAWRPQPPNNITPSEHSLGAADLGIGRYNTIGGA